MVSQWRSMLGGYPCRHRTGELFAMTNGGFGGIPSINKPCESGKVLIPTRHFSISPWRPFNMGWSSPFTYHLCFIIGPIYRWYLCVELSYRYSYRYSDLCILTYWCILSYWCILTLCGICPHMRTRQFR